MNNWSKKQKIYFFLIALLVALFDQFVKLLVLANLYDGQVIPVIPGFFNLVLTFNPGVAFGIFSGIENELLRLLVLSLTTLIALGAVYWFAIGELGSGARSRFALSLVIGGAIGNIIDRIRLGKVIDYLDFYYQGYHWPAFNIADSCICVAMFILIFDSLKSANTNQEQG